MPRLAARAGGSGGGGTLLLALLLVVSFAANFGALYWHMNAGGLAACARNLAMEQQQADVLKIAISHERALSKLLENEVENINANVAKAAPANWPKGSTRDAEESLNECNARFAALSRAHSEMMVETAAVLKQIDRMSEVNDNKTLSVSKRRPLNLVFWVNPLPPQAQGVGRSNHFDFLFQVVFARLFRPIFVRNTTVIVNDSINLVYILERGHSPWPNSLSQHNDSLVNVGALHGADEQHKSLTHNYKNVDFVLRNYYRPLSSAKERRNTHYLPLGWATGFSPIPPSILLPASRRTILCNFYGSFSKHNETGKADRRDMWAYAIAESWPCDFNVHDMWQIPMRATHMVHYKMKLLNSVFTLAPEGENPETHRLYEALETGSIPVMKRISNDAFDFITHGLGPDVPFPVLDSWAHFLPLLRHYSEHPAKLDQLQQNMVDWWARKKVEIGDHVRLVIDTSFAKAYGDGS